MADAPTLHGLGTVADIDGKPVNLASFAGKIVVVVNVACE